MSFEFSQIFGKSVNVPTPDSETFDNSIKNDKDAVLLDVRTEKENREVRIPNSVLIDIYQPSFVSEIEKLDRSKNYFVYCRSGHRSYHAAKQMLQMGFEKVYNLVGGIIKWDKVTERG